MNIILKSAAYATLLCISTVSIGMDSSVQITYKLCCDTKELKKQINLLSTSSSLLESDKQLNMKKIKDINCKLKKHQKAINNELSEQYCNRVNLGLSHPNNIKTYNKNTSKMDTYDKTITFLEKTKEDTNILVNKIKSKKITMNIKNKFKTTTLNQKKTNKTHQFIDCLIKTSDK